MKTSSKTLTMAEQVLADTSCLILFNKVGHLNLLHSVYGELLITPEISEEYKRRIPDWIQVKPMIDSEQFKANRTIVDYGEASIITLALEVQFPLLIIDDKRGRKLAQALNLPITGTLGTLIKAKRMGAIDQIKPLLQDLKSNGLRISDQMETFILKEAHE